MSLAERVLEQSLGAGPYDTEVRVGADNVFTVRGWVTLDGSRGELTGEPGVGVTAGMDPRLFPASGELTVPLRHERMVRLGVTPSHPLYYAWLLDGAAPEAARELEQAQPPFDWAGVVSFEQARQRHPLQRPGVLQRWRSAWRTWAPAVPIQVSSDGGMVVIAVTGEDDGDSQPSRSTAHFAARTRH